MSYLCSHKAENTELASTKSLLKKETKRFLQASGQNISSDQHTYLFYVRFCYRTTLIILLTH